MNKLLLFLLFGLIPIASFACDETCKRSQAEAKNNIKFPSYLSEKYCSNLKTDFMSREIKSLQKYRQTQLASMHRGGMNNINQFIGQREEWLQECDNYLQMTFNSRLFGDDETTDKVFDNMSALQQELSSLIKGVTYSSENQTEVAEQKFDKFFQVVDDHQTLMLIKGRMVLR